MQFCQNYRFRLCKERLSSARLDTPLGPRPRLSRMPWKAQMCSRRRKPARARRGIPLRLKSCYQAYFTGHFRPCVSHRHANGDAKCTTNQCPAVASNFTRRPSCCGLSKPTIIREPQRPGPGGSDSGRPEDLLDSRLIHFRELPNTGAR